MKKLMFLMSIFMLACGGGGGGGDTIVTPASTTPKIFTMVGKAEKGPLQKGAIVQAAQWSVETEYTGLVFVSATTDNQGAYTLAGSTLSGILDISADGFFINENTGVVSDSRIVLSGLVDSATQSEGNINIVTHIIKKRVMSLLRSGKTFSEANNQAITELYANLGWTAENPLNTSISQNGKLLFLSAALCKNRSVDQVSNLLTTLTNDMEDGSINISSLDDSFINIDCATVESNVYAMYGSSPDLDTIKVDVITFRGISGPAPIIRIVDPVPAADFYWFTDSKQLSKYNGSTMTILTGHALITQEGEDDIEKTFTYNDFFKIGNIIYFSCNYDGTMRYYQQENSVVSEIESLPSKPEATHYTYSNSHYNLIISYWGEIPVSDLVNLDLGGVYYRNYMVSNCFYAPYLSWDGMWIEVHDPEEFARPSGLYFLRVTQNSSTKLNESGRMWK